VPPGRQPPAPGSCVSHRVRFDFPQLSLLPVGRFHLAVPRARPRPFTCFRFAAPREVGDILRYGCYPCLIQAESEPPGRRPPAPSPPISSPRPVTGVTSEQLGPASLSVACAASRLVVFTLRIPSLIEAYATLFSITQRRCRPTASSVCTLPLFLRVEEYPLAANQPAPGSHSAASDAISHTDLSPEPWRLSSRRFSISVVRLSTSRFSGPRGPGDHFRHRHLPYAQVCILPLLVSPNSAS